MTTDYGFGQQRPGDTNSDDAVIAFICRQLIAQMSTMKPVKVLAVTAGEGDGDARMAGTVDVQPLVSQVDGNGYGVPHGTVPGIPWSRLQGGRNAVICDPQVGDIGYVVASDRDMSVVKSTRAAGLPGSGRTFDIADGVYVGGCLNVAPDQYLVFREDGIRLVSRDGSSVELLDGAFRFTDSHGNVLSSGAGGIDMALAPGGDFTVNGIGFLAHLHFVSGTPGNSGPPLP